jgi:hypothetical protein
MPRFWIPRAVHLVRYSPYGGVSSFGGLCDFLMFNPLFLFINVAMHYFRGVGMLLQRFLDGVSEHH